jgi:thioredoxin-related protein
MRFAFLSVVALALLINADRSHAGIDETATATNASQWQLVVIEASGCIYCKIFRRDVLPSYETSAEGKELPVRFVDVNAIDSNHLEFKSPISIVPTFVVVKSNQEIGRIAGYMGPEDFHHSIKYLLTSAP